MEKQYLIVGPECGRDTDGKFRCVCGKCRELEPGKIPGGYDIRSSPRKERRRRILNIVVPFLAGFLSTLLLSWLAMEAGLI